jgi:hypothetical protein
MVLGMQMAKHKTWCMADQAVGNLARCLMGRQISHSLKLDFGKL